MLNYMQNDSVYKSTFLPHWPVENWIKNVYRQRAKTGITSDQLSTPSRLTYQFAHSAVYNSPVTPLFVQVFTALFSTLKITKIDLLIQHLYPQSTPPINKKKNGKMERNT
jgi:hypothetical protein